MKILFPLDYILRRGNFDHVGIVDCTIAFLFKM